MLHIVKTQTHDFMNQNRELRIIYMNINITGIYKLIINRCIFRVRNRIDNNIELVIKLNLRTSFTSFGDNLTSGGRSDK